MLLGVTALLRPMLVHDTVVVREIPMLLLTCGAAIVLSFDHWLGGDVNAFSRGDGAMLLLLFGVFLYYTMSDALRQRSDAFLDEANQLTEPHTGPLARAWLPPLLVLAGLVLLIAGGRLTVTGAVQLAQGLGVSEVVIGLTLVAVGTSLPELVTCLIAAWRSQSDVAIGTIVGSNIYNLLFIQGTTMSIAPAALPTGGAGDLLVMTVFSAVLLPLAVTHQRRLMRWEGGLLLAGYVTYVVWLATRG